jgi:hypothetical protein
VARPIVVTVADAPARAARVAKVVVAGDRDVDLAFLRYRPGPGR